MERGETPLLNLFPLSLQRRGGIKGVRLLNNFILVISGAGAF